MRWAFSIAALAALGFGCAKPCDINMDGDVNDLDPVEFQSLFGLREGDPGYNKRADFDGDEDIDLSDFNAYLAECGGE